MVFQLHILINMDFAINGVYDTTLLENLLYFLLLQNI